MNATRKDQKGFGTVEALLIVLIVIALVGVGYMIFNKQKDKSSSADQKTTTSDTSDNESTSGGVKDVDEAVKKLGDKITQLGSGKFTVEEIQDRGEISEIKTSATNTVSISEKDNITFRTDVINSGNYDVYVADVETAGASLNAYAANQLGLKKLYTHEITGPTGDIFVQTSYQVGDSYLAVETGPTAITIGWAK